MLREARNTAGEAPALPTMMLKTSRRRQTGRFPGFQAAGHGADVFVAHFLQGLGGKCGPAAAAAMTNDHCVWVGHFFFDVELDRAATHVSRAGNVSFIPFVFIADIDYDRVAAV